MTPQIQSIIGAIVCLFSVAPIDDIKNNNKWCGVVSLRDFWFNNCLLSLWTITYINHHFCINRRTRDIGDVDER